MRRVIVAIIVVLVGRASAAVPFPPDDQWVAFRCGTGLMTDPVGDDPPFLAELDLVGDNTNAAGYHAADATNLYLRIRVDADPTNGGALRASAWGYEFDLDNDPTTYELLIGADGIAAGGAVVAIYANTATTIANSPADPADMPPLQTFAFATNGRAIAASGSTFGGNADFFVDFAVPWTAIAPHGLDHTTSVRVWAGSSNASGTLNGDIACQDARTGAPTLGGSVSTTTTADPGGVGSGGGSGELVGGERCAVGGGGGCALVVLVVALAMRRRSSLPRLAA
jgi:hypothetical protein